MMQLSSSLMRIFWRIPVKLDWNAFRSATDVGFRPVEKAEHQGCCRQIPLESGRNRNLALDSGTPTNRNESRNVPPRSCQLVVASPLVVPSLRRPLIFLSRQLVVTLPLTILSLRHPLINSSRQLVVHRLSLSSRCAPRRPLVLSSCRLVVALPLNAPPSRHLIVS
jgi:hypothetical protein